MSFHLSSWAIKRPLVPFIVLIALVITGIVDYFKLPVNHWPNVQIPVVNVSVVLPGASANEIEVQITRRVESSLSNIENIRHLTSTIKDNVSSTEIEFQLGTNIDQALIKVRDQISLIRPLLPQGIDEPVIQHIEADMLPILTYTITSSNHSLEQASWFVDSNLTSTLLAIKGVAKIQRQGGETREIHIELDAQKLRAYAITAEMINNQLKQFALTLPAGRVNKGAKEILIKTTGSPRDVESLAGMMIPLRDGHSVRLKDLGSVQDTVSETRQLARFNHQPVVAFAVYRSQLADEIKVEQRVTKALETLHQLNPSYTFTLIQSQVDYTKESYQSAIWSFIEGALLASIVIFIFLRTYSATWITAIVIPLSIIPTFMVMQWLDFSLNIVSLLSLSLVSGILVDDTIVEIENIIRHIKMGKSPYQAAIDAADEIGLVVVATSAVIIAVFVPVSFMGGVVGQYFKQFGITVAVATFFSLLVARLITPVMAAYFLKPVSQPVPEPVWLVSYLALLKKVLRNRKLTLLCGAFIVMATVAIGVWLPTDFMPAEDKSQSTLQLVLAPGSRLADTDLAVRQLSNILLNDHDVKSVYALIGAVDIDTDMEGEVREATLTIKLKPRNQRSQDIQTFEKSMLQVLSKLPNMRIGFLNENGDKAVTLGLVSDNKDLLQQTAHQLEKEMRALKQLSNITSSAPLPRAELRVIPRNQDAARLGVSSESIANGVRIASVGDQNANLTRLNIDDRQIPVRILLNGDDKINTDFINQLLIPSNTNQLIPLAAVADVILSSGTTSITRFDRHRQIKLEADLKHATLGEALSKIDQLPTMQHLPTGVARFDTGDSELLNDMFDSFSMAIVVGLLLVFAVLVLLFRTFFQPITIMLALPLSISGALIALLLSQSALSLPAVIGILMLLGIVGKNGILLVDFMIEHGQAGMSRQVAIIEACQQRARPIVMTTLAMIAGMLPVIFGLGAGTEFRTPMALAVIGGLITSTALSLLFIPVIYTYVNDFELWLQPRLNKLIGIT